MILQDFMQMFMEPGSQRISLFDLSAGETIFEGEYRDMPNEDWDYCEICSIDTLFNKTDTLTINLDIAR